MRIGILTFSRSINYGAFLQCYSLYSKLKKIIEAEVEVINYNTLTAEVGFLITSLLRGPIKGVRQYRTFRNTADENMELSARYISNNYQKSVRFINALNYDLIITGSDEVWKIDKIRKYPNIYWKSSDLKGKKISYAASANRTFFDRLPDSVVEDIQKELNGYWYLGIRDKNTYELLTGLNLAKQVNMNCDPSFLYEFIETPKLENKLTEKYKINLDKPIIGIITANKKVGQAIKNRFGSTHQIVALTCNNKYADVWLYDLTPFEWANVFKYFSGCVTSYFHGTIFSILNKIPFVSFDYEEYSLRYRTKVRDILEKADLLESYCNILEKHFNFDDLITKLEINMRQEKEFINKLDVIITNERKKFDFFEKELLHIMKGL